MNQFETRMLEASELRAEPAAKNEPLTIKGYAATFNSVAKLPSFRERFMPGAFTRAIDERHDVVCLFNHDPGNVLGRTSSGTLKLKQDDKGLAFTCVLPETRTAQDLHESIRRGDINGCSLAFMVPEDGSEWSEGSDNGEFFVLRSISDVDLKDVSPVTYPAYSGTSIAARCVEAPVELRSAVDAKNGVTDETRAWKQQANERLRKLQLDRCAEIEAELSKPVGHGASF